MSTNAHLVDTLLGKQLDVVEATTNKLLEVTQFSSNFIIAVESFGRDLRAVIRGAPDLSARCWSWRLMAPSRLSAISQHFGAPL